jgi:hypothetical protein
MDDAVVTHRSATPLPRYSTLRYGRSREWCSPIHLHDLPENASSHPPKRLQHSECRAAAIRNKCSKPHSRPWPYQVRQEIQCSSRALFPCSGEAALLSSRAGSRLLRLEFDSILLGQGCQSGLLECLDPCCPHGHGNGHDLLQLNIRNPQFPCNCKAVACSGLASRSKGCSKRDQVLGLAVDQALGIGCVEKLLVLAKHIL